MVVPRGPSEHAQIHLPLARGWETNTSVPWVGLCSGSKLQDREAAGHKLAMETYASL